MTAVATVLSVVIANKLTFARSNKEKLWDLRRQAYGVILSNLATVERVCRHADAYIEEDAMRYFHGDQYTARNDRIAEHMGAVRSRFSDDYLIMSDKFASLLERFLDEVSAGAPDEMPDEEHDRFVAVLRTNRPGLIVQARSEIAAHDGLLRTRFWPWLRRPHELGGNLSS